MSSAAGGDATPLYRRRAAAAGYDVLNALLWLPGGSDRLRRAFVGSLQVHPGDRVLELGCGTGLVTRHLCAAGAVVTAVDRAGGMLAVARRRAPAARFVDADLGALTVADRFDHVVLAFVLHELDPDRRVDVLRRSAGWLAPGGRIGILEWSAPAAPLRRRAWATVVRAIEPRVAHDILDRGLTGAIARAGLTIETDRAAAGGRARLTTVAAQPDGRPADGPVTKATISSNDGS